MKGSAIRITKRAVDALKPGEYLWDSEVSGFGVRRTAGGYTSYVLRYRSIARQQRYLTIGRHGSPWTPESARQRAKALVGEVVTGGDPAQERDTKRSALTLKEFSDIYLADHALPKKKPRSAEGDAINLRRHILPRLGRLLLEDIGRGDIARLHAEMKSTPATANRCQALLSKMFSLAERWGYLKDRTDILRGVDRYPEKPRNRFLSAAEREALRKAITEEEMSGRSSPMFLALVKLLAFTGARLSEIRTARWSDLDVHGRRLVLADSKTGAKSILLGDAALEVIGRLPRFEGNPYLLPGSRTGQPLVGVQKAWQRLRLSAGLPNVRLHDLRHTFASVMASHGHSLIAIGSVLGHRQVGTTARYAHLTKDPVHAAANDASAEISGRVSAV